MTASAPLLKTVPAVSLLAALLMAPTVGSEPRFSVQGQSTAAGRGTVQTAPPQTGRNQTTPTAGAAGQQPGQRPQPTVEGYLGRDLWWKNEAIRKEMKLTDAQVRSINNIFDNRVKYVTPYFDEFTKQMAELDRMTQERTVDVATFEIQVNHAESARSKLNETRTVMLYRIYKLLTPEQYQTLRDIRDREMRDRATGRGRGGAPSPGRW